MLGRLARYLRMIGIDCLYEKNWDKDIMIKISNEQKRVVLTRDLSLIKRRDLKYYFFIESDDPQKQVKKVINDFKIVIKRRTKRCPLCNELLLEVSKHEIKDKIWPFVYKNFDKFYMCSLCGRIYWGGSHVSRFLEMLKD